MQALVMIQKLTVMVVVVKFKALAPQELCMVVRGGNRLGRPTGAYGLAYLKSNSAQLVY
jgi:hypothetical protein